MYNTFIFFLFICPSVCYIAPSHWGSYMCPLWVMNFCDACTVWLVWLTLLLFTHTYTLLRADCPGSSNPSQRAHTPWPAGWWCLWVHCSGLAPGPCLGSPVDVCALALLDSLPHSAVRDLPIQLAFTFRQQLHSSCTNMYTLNSAYINDFMLELLCVGGSDILRSCGGCSSGGLMRRNADSFKGTDWWEVMAWHQLDWTGLQEVDFEVCMHKSDCLDLDTVGLQVLWLKQVHCLFIITGFLIMGFHYYIWLWLQPFPELWFIFEGIRQRTNWTAWAVIVDGLRWRKGVTIHSAQAEWGPL